VSYPVTVTIPSDPGQNRLWGVPFLGIFVRWVLVIPQFIILFVVGIAAYIAILFNWIPILVNGRQAGLVYTIIGGYLRLSAQVGMYVSLITGAYPPFGLTGDHPVKVTFEEGEEQNRLWGIPLLGVSVRLILLIPHWIVIWFLAIGLSLLFVVSWIPVLVNGRQADWIVGYFAGFYRWSTRAAAYALLLTGTYPPFRWSD
jgi:hypothetical protein